jgi:cation diffusion facilitator CzcD-associated flavoprotein CzcO
MAMTAVDRNGEQQAPTESYPQSVDVAIIGSGFSGLGMAIRLEQQGRGDYVVLERGEEVGGTWEFNTYPGCACDIPSHLYSYSFALNPDWSQTYSRQPEIREYLRGCADRFGVRRKVRFGCELTAARWDEAGERWELETTIGPLRARVLIAAAGPLFEPKYPDLPGLDDFRGTVFHSARWDHDYELAGKRVAVIGTGASAIQFVPEIQSEVEQLHVFQRTPPWVTPSSNRPVSAFERRLYRAFPAAQRAVRAFTYAIREILVLGFVKRPRLMRSIERLASRHLTEQVSDPELLEKVQPDYSIGCKRIAPSNDWYPALGKPNVELVTDAIREVKANSIVDSEGVERHVDAMVLATGYHVTDMPIARAVFGRGGRSLDEIWRGSPRAHRGSTVAGFPNLFLLLGPNTGLGHNSMVYMIESQLSYVLDALRTMEREGAATAEVKPEVERSYNESIDDRMQGTVWNTGCSSWYFDSKGRNGAIWPDWTWRFRQQTSRFDVESYTLRAAVNASAVAAAAEHAL